MPTVPAQLRPLLLLLAIGAAQTQAIAQADSGATPHLPKARSRSTQGLLNPSVVLLDPAHGGPDEGAQLGGVGTEKDFNQAFGNRLKDLLTAKNFLVTLTHADAAEAVTLDQRAEIANRSHAGACLILHATSVGHGAHLFTSALTPRIDQEDRADASIQPWDTVQMLSLPSSLRLANELSSVLTAARLPVILAAVSIRPIDSMSCPTVAIEIAPATSRLGLSDESYLQRLAGLLVETLASWRQQALDRAAQAEAAQSRQNEVDASTTSAGKRASRSSSSAAPVRGGP